MRPVKIMPMHPGKLFDAAVAALTLIAADVVVRFMPFAAITRRIERPPRRRPPADAAAAVRRVTWAVDAAHRRLRWIPCFAVAIAANRLLAWRGIASELWLGVRSHPIGAHAWVVAEGRVVAGEAEDASYEPFHVLVTPRLGS